MNVPFVLNRSLQDPELVALRCNVSYRVSLRIPKLTCVKSRLAKQPRFAPEPPSRPFGRSPAFSYFRGRLYRGRERRTTEGNPAWNELSHAAGYADVPHGRRDATDTRRVVAVRVPRDRAGARPNPRRPGRAEDAGGALGRGDSSANIFPGSSGTPGLRASAKWPPAGAIDRA